MKITCLIVSVFLICSQNTNAQVVVAQPGPPAVLNQCTGTYQNNPAWLSDPLKLFTVCDNVKVGIGTATPLYKLHVKGKTYGESAVMGDIYGSSDALYNGFGTTIRPSLMKLGLNLPSQPSQLLFHFTGDGTLIINNRIGPAMVINSNTGDKILQLENDGLLRARGVRVDEDNWPDYVFKADYILPDLNSVEKYIADNKHLPGIPSAKEIQLNGLNLGEITKLQMEKIEELTLYTIEQEKKISSLETRLLELEKLLK